MQGLVYAAVETLSAAVVIMILIVFIWRYCCHRKVTVITEKTKVESVRSGIGKLPMTNESQDRDSFAGFHHQDTQNRVSYSVFRRGIPPNASFNWADHPWLVSEAVEYGWSRFGFTAETPSPSTRSNLLGLCSAADQGRDTTVDINWEVCAESVDFMQKIRFNPESMKIDMGTAPSCASSSCVIVKSSLPLPGPPLENSSFPQEAYFEITIKSCPNDEVESVISAKRSPGSGELTKLIPQKSNVSVQSDSLIHFKEINGSGRTQELKLRINEEGGQNEMTVFSVGFSVGGSLPRQIPGSYAGSIGFNSNGSLFLDGMKLVSEAEKTEWDSRDKVIGCGFDPSQKKVFFTVDSELVHVINCKSDEFNFPLYPTLAANV
ncbi:uncharacterized protein LOC122071297 [Macadamia integrifolia]|uniref:uncharacterized protein LOC122071297 n=1 Tax=Macadamia integrifolia TaxID=60698 RepID=UPI001C4EC80C|nr:uncharacterized protein LOC122071297 [Macadamia integrifolia]